MSKGELIRPQRGPKKNRPEPASSKISINSVLKNKDFIVGPKENTGFRGGSFSRKQKYLLAMYSILAGFVDGCAVLFIILVMAASSLFIFNHFQTEKLFLASKDILILFGSLYVGFALFYLIFMRLLIGQTLGEWTCGLYLGFPKQRLAKNYALKVLARSLLIFASGIILFPMINLIFAVDLAGKICQINLVSKN